MRNMTNRRMNWKTISGSLCLAFAATTALPTFAGSPDWPQWGGPSRDFKVAAPKLADSWPESGPTVKWRRPLGEGYSAIAAKGGDLYTMYRKDGKDVVVALSADTGKTKWEYAYDAPPHEGSTDRFGTGPNATPLVLDDRVITLGFTGIMQCVDRAAGKPIWSHDLVKEYGGSVLKFGSSASPLLYKGNVIALVGGEKNGIMAFNPKDGAIAWKSEPYDVSYASPIVINVDGQDQIVFFSSSDVMGVDAANGKFLWSYPCSNQYKNNATDAIWGEDNLLWAATQLDGGARVLRLSQKNGKTSVEKVWESDKIKVFHWNAVRVKDHIYASIGGKVTLVSAVNVKTGEVAWKERGFHKANCIYADDKLIFVDENGVLAMAKVSPKGMEILGKTELLEKVAWTVPTLVGDQLYVRDTKEIVALDLGKKG
ncbi:MAG: polyvinylalcohol dehydrogenase [Phycisphaerae bacterium]|nr:MAG: polyvinylalcohol dehydrogenase [Phycisphaerae bacterium]